MAPVHLFSDSHSTVVAITGLLRSEFVVHVHQCSQRLPRCVVEEGGCIVFDMDEHNGWWRAMLADALAKPFLPIVLITKHPVARDIVLAVNIGAKDVVDCTTDAVRLRQVVHDLTGTPMAGAGPSSSRHHRLECLTRRQREILALAATGVPSKVIAKSLSISKRTVDAHRSRMVRRLKAGSFLELVREQIRHEVEIGA